MVEANRENEHDQVFGKSFALYDKEEMDKFVAFFRQRFKANGIDPKKVFSGKRCLDAGCGNGRGTLFMLENGAKHVTSVDISPTNIESTDRNCRAFGFDAYDTRLVTLEHLPFDDEEFDFVWCNGVVMHTANPDASLYEISRVLRVGGESWIYVYGAGGLYWYLVEAFRKILNDVSAEQTLVLLQLMRLPVRYIGEYMDDWKVPYLRAYTAEEFSRRLTNFGFSAPTPLSRGVGYDTSERRTLFPQDKPWLGEGDLRYLAKKCSRSIHSGTSLYDRTLPHGNYSQEVISLFGPLVEQLAARTSGNSALAIIACSYIQRELRDALSMDGVLDIAGFADIFGKTLTKLK
jgi:ubiquinone/menaquinone biosynthesis C-methylase UbiE